ncbi:MAG: ABC-F family ATP-binding cassette domain-containing protein [Thermomicrobiales bacterium]|nr:ABC-F family ATP-binding cassette domain-containing protein [Thermomicrobiales bacterium]
MPPAVPLLSVTDLTKTFITETIFKGVSFQVREREKVALVGVNGAGKSTILRIIAGIEHANGGEIATQPGLRITYLPQEARFTSDNTLREEAKLAFAPVLAMQDRMREIEQQMGDAEADLEALMDEYDRLSIHFESASGYDIEHRTDEILQGLGFTQEMFDDPVARLSGGQKTRVALAKALLADPDLLLLDEPTNHLDLEMLEWLEEFLAKWNGACLIVSHDRYFLDRTTSRTLDLSFGTLEDYPASYAKYLPMREERKIRRIKEYEEQQEYIARQEEFIRKYGNGQRYREARGRQKKLDRLERLDRPQDYEEMHLRLPANLRSGRMVLTSSRMEIGYRDPEGPAIYVRTPELQIERGDRIGLLGPNGAGKTTLIKSLVGQLPLLKGEYSYGTNVKPGYYAQSHEQLRGKGSGTPLSVIMETQIMSEEYARTYLGRFLFSGDDVYKHINDLSGGERSRLALGVLLLEQANFLILDEPTNHLDIQSRETLEQMLNDFDGTILFVSHDRFFMDKIATKLWIVENGEMSFSLGNYTDYQRQLGRRAATPVTTDKPTTTAQSTARVDTTDTPASTDPLVEITSKGKPKRRTNTDVQKRLAKVERSIAQLEGKLNELNDAMTVATIDQDIDAISTLGTEFERVQSELDGVYTEWEELTEAALEMEAV